MSEKGGKYNCKACGKQMSNMGKLNAHIRAAHEGIKYSCQQCLYQATTKGHLDQHRRSVHEGMKLLKLGISLRFDKKYFDQSHFRRFVIFSLVQFRLLRKCLKVERSKIYLMDFRPA